MRVEPVTCGFGSLWLYPLGDIKCTIIPYYEVFFDYWTIWNQWYNLYYPDCQFDQMGQNWISSKWVVLSSYEKTSLQKLASLLKVKSGLKKCKSVVKITAF